MGPSALRLACVYTISLNRNLQAAFTMFSESGQIAPPVVAFIGKDRGNVIRQRLSLKPKSQRSDQPFSARKPKRQLVAG